MKVGSGIEILDPYEWLPGHGENAVKIRTEGTELIVAVMYDCDAGTCERELRFGSVCSFYSQIFPGPSMLEIEGVEAAMILRGVLIEYPASEAAMAWSQHFGSSSTIQQYSIVFLAENLLLVVLAGSVVLNESASRVR